MLDKLLIHESHIVEYIVSNDWFLSILKNLDHLSEAELFLVAGLDFFLLLVGQITLIILVSDRCTT